MSEADKSTLKHFIFMSIPLFCFFCFKWENFGAASESWAVWFARSTLCCALGESGAVQLVRCIAVIWQHICTVSKARYCLYVGFKRQHDSEMGYQVANTTFIVHLDVVLSTNKTSSLDKALNIMHVHCNRMIGNKKHYFSLKFDSFTIAFTFLQHSSCR